MVLCECGAELEIIDYEDHIESVSCPKCGLEYKRSFIDTVLLEIRREHFVWKLFLCDFWRVFKRKDVNFAFEFTPKSGWWFEWWTPTWHFGKGPYITIGFWRLRFYRGY